MRMLFQVFTGMALFVLLGEAVGVQPVKRLGPAVGDRLTAMKPLRDQRGNLADLASVVGPAGGLVAVLRSAEW